MAQQNQNQNPTGGYRPRINLARARAQANNPGCLWIVLAVLAVLLLLALLHPDLSDPFGLNTMKAQNAAQATQIVQLQAGQGGGNGQGTPVPTPGSIVDPKGTGNLGVDVVYLNGSNVGTVMTPQTQIEHPSFYIETGTTGSATWTIGVPSNGVMIVGGSSVDGLSNGVLKGYAGGTTYTVNVTNGFALVTKTDMGAAEFCFRLAQTVTYGWAHSNVLPLSGWTACSTTSLVGPTATPGTNTTHTRVTTGDQKTMRFNAGDSVVGWKILLDNGKSCDGGNCYVANAPSGGSVTSGVINPWTNEVPANAKNVQ